MDRIINWSSPGFEPRSQGPKAATLPLCYMYSTDNFSFLFRARVVIQPRSTRASRQRIQARASKLEKEKQQEREKREDGKEWLS